MNGDLVHADVIQNVLGLLFAATVIRYAWKGGPVRYGTIPMPVEGRVLIGICALTIFGHCARRLVGLAWR